MKTGLYAFTALVLLTSSGFAQKKNPWEDGIVKKEFLYDTASFPSCHAATIAETPGGLVTAFFGGTRERHPDVEIYVCRQINGKWTKPVSVANGIVNDSLRLPTWNPVLYQVPNGPLLLMYKIGPKPSEWHAWMKTSKDNGKTWSKPVALQQEAIGPVKNKIVRLKNGTLIAPASTEGKGWRLHMEFSKDNGKTWTIGPDIPSNGIEAIQPSVLFLKDGRLQLLARTRNRMIATSYSSDQGKTWTPLADAGLPNNNSGTDAVTLKDGRQALVYNHVLPPDSQAKGPRTPLNLSWSNDGRNWFAAAILEDSPISQYSYPSIIQGKDGMIHIVYTWRREKIRYVKVDPKKMSGIPIRNGEWPMKKGYIAPVAGEITND